MKKVLDGKTVEPVELQVRSFKKTMKTRDMVNQTELLQHNITIEYLPHGSDMPYRIIVGNNSINFVDPWGLRITQVWRPLAGGLWPLGYHTAINVNGEIYGYGPEGVRRENPSDYNVWGGHEIVIYGGDEFDQAMQDYLRNAAAGNDPRSLGDNYNPVQNNCISFVDCAIKDVINPEDARCQ